MRSYSWYNTNSSLDSPDFILSQTEMLGRETDNVGRLARARAALAHFLHLRR